MSRRKHLLYVCILTYTAKKNPILLGLFPIRYQKSQCSVGGFCYLQIDLAYKTFILFYYQVWRVFFPVYALLNRVITFWEMISILPTCHVSVFTSVLWFSLILSPWCCHFSLHFRNSGSPFWWSHTGLLYVQTICLQTPKWELNSVNNNQIQHIIVGRGGRIASKLIAHSWVCKRGKLPSCNNNNKNQYFFCT